MSSGLRRQNDPLSLQCLEMEILGSESQAGLGYFRCFWWFLRSIFSCVVQVPVSFRSAVATPKLHLLEEGSSPGEVHCHHLLQQWEKWRGNASSFEGNRQQHMVTTCVTGPAAPTGCEGHCPPGSALVRGQWKGLVSSDSLSKPCNRS